MPGLMEELVVEGAKLKCSMSVDPTGATGPMLKVTTPAIPPPPPGPPPPLPPGAERLRKHRRQRTPVGGAAKGGRVTCDGKRIATVLDCKHPPNIGSFGMCKSPMNPQVAAANGAPQKCTPVILTNWSPASPDVTFGIHKAVRKRAICRCQWGGIITVVMPGQKSTKDTPTPPVGAPAPADDWSEWFRPDLNPKMKKSYWTKLKRKQRRVRFK